MVRHKKTYTQYKKKLKLRNREKISKRCKIIIVAAGRISLPMAPFISCLFLSDVIRDKKKMKKKETGRKLSNENNVNSFVVAMFFTNRKSERPMASIYQQESRI